MQLIGELKKKVAKTKGLDEAGEVIEKAGMRLTKEELVSVVGAGGKIEEWLEQDTNELDFESPNGIPGSSLNASDQQIK